MTTDIPIKEIVELNKQGLSRREIAKHFGCSPVTISRRLAENKVIAINHHNAIKFDNTVFDTIDTEEKAYWLGFLYADGSVSSSINNVELSLSIKDIEHLEKFRRFLKKQTPINTSFVTIKGQKYERCRCTVTDKHLKQQLIYLGCLPNKSKTLTLRTDIFETPDLIYPFIRGYVDGDGCISFTSTGRLNLQIIGTPAFLLGIKQLFPEFGSFVQDKRRNSCIRVISCAANKADKVLTKLYKGATIYLERKYNRLAVLSSNW